MSEQAQQSKSDKDDWRTPERITTPLRLLEDGFDMDPCADPDRELARVNISPPQDGLSVPWEGIVFVNPPFSEKTRWMEKAVEEMDRNAVERIYLVTPDATDVKSHWHKFIVPNATFTTFFRGRVKYIDPDTGEAAGSPSFGTALHVLGSEPPSSVLRWMNNEGDLVRRPSVFL